MKRTGLYAASYVMRNHHAWPGGYPLAIVMDDGGLLCPNCIKAEFEQIAWSWVNKVWDGWFPVHLTVLDDPSYAATCAHCGKRIL